jgi:alcohol dehydrogenase, propanol-preferring
VLSANAALAGAFQHRPRSDTAGDDHGLRHTEKGGGERQPRRRAARRRAAPGALGPDRVIGVFGIGGLGGYAVQYAKILGSGATIVAFARNSDKLAIAKDYGADHVIAIKGKSSADISKELNQATGRFDLDAIIDCAGARR